VSQIEFVMLSTVVVARQMTLVDHELFCAIQPQELMIFLWGDPRVKKTGVSLRPNLTAYVEHFNRVSFWACTEICTAPDVAKRVQVIEKIIDMLKIFREFNSFNLLMALIAALNHSSVQRLKKTWEVVSNRSLQILHEIEKTLNPIGNYATYREIESKKYPCFIPFFGLLMKDLIFANDGNPKKLENGLYNFSKLRQLAGLVERIMIWQSSDYEIERAPGIYEYCCNLIYIEDEDRLYKYSYLCEPRISGENEAPIRLLHKWQNQSQSLNFIERWTKDL